MPLISVITINLNNAKGLRRTLNSVITQDFTNYEYIIVDGRSTDESVEVIKENSEKVTYWISEKDEGLYDAMNKGIAMARGEYCIFLNSGDSFYNNKVLQKVYDAGLNTDIIYGDVLYAKDGLIVKQKKNPARLSIIHLMATCIDHQVQFIRKKLFDDYGNYSTNYKICADYECFVRQYFKAKATIKHIPVDIAIYDVVGISSNPYNTLQGIKERKSIHKLYFPKILYISYYRYVTLREKFITNSILKVPINYFNKCILKLIGVK